MTAVLRLDAFDVQPGTGAGWLILVKGDRCYKNILRRAFPACSFTHSFPDKKGIYDWGTYVHDLADTHDIERLLTILCNHLLLPNDLDECMALDWHQSRPFDRTELGELVYQAKYHGGQDSVEELRHRFLSFATSHPTYSRADAIVPVPSSEEGIPDLLSRHLARRLDKEYGGGWIVRKRATRPQKDVHTPQEKVENVSGVFECSVSPHGKSIILIDDLYQSGATINEVGRVLKNAEAGDVLGIVATKTLTSV